MNEQAAIKSILTEMFMTPSQKVQNSLRDSLSGTDKIVSPNSMYRAYIKKLVTRPAFNKIWSQLVRDGYLIKMGANKFQWEQWQNNNSSTIAS